MAFREWHAPNALDIGVRLAHHVMLKQVQLENIINPKQSVLDWLRTVSDDVAVTEGFPFEPGFFVNQTRYSIPEEHMVLLNNYLLGRTALANGKQRPLNEAELDHHFSIKYHVYEKYMMEFFTDVDPTLAKLIVCTTHQSGLFGFTACLMTWIAQQSGFFYSMSAREKHIDQPNDHCISITEVVTYNARSSENGVMQNEKNLAVKISVDVEMARINLPQFSNWKISILYDDIRSMSGFIVLKNRLQSLDLNHYATTQINLSEQVLAPLFEQTMDEALLKIRRDGIEPVEKKPGGKENIITTPTTTRKVFPATPPRRVSPGKTGAFTSKGQIPRPFHLQQ